MSEYIAKAPIEPRDYRVVFLIQKDTGGYRRLHLWIKLPSDRGSSMPENLNLQIEQLLDRCRQSL